MTNPSASQKSFDYFVNALGHRFRGVDRDAVIDVGREAEFSIPPCSFSDAIGGFDGIGVEAVETRR